ncbi:MAG: deoxyribodipyrimidine photo-lyase [Chloroflexi bacterium]|nr:deoxyribodipyrimidine photo-lyase [Chloroflexota bacterium]
MPSSDPGGGERWRTAVVWFRRDLRLHDHPALADAISRAGMVVPLFVFDDALLGGRWPAPNRVWFMDRSARLLDQALRDRGSRLHVRTGRPAEVVPRFAAEVGADVVLVSRDYGPYARLRDGQVGKALESDGRSLRARRGILVHEPEEVISAAGGPFSVFTPFHRAWRQLPLRDALDAPRSIDLPGSADPGTWPSSADLRVPERPPADLPEPGEEAARDRLGRWLRSGLDDYHSRRDDLAADGTSRLSQDLHWGLLSPLEVYRRAKREGRGPAAYCRQLVWREFYHHVLWHRPGVTRGPYLAQFEGMAWSEDEDDFQAWCAGSTGYPVVDAAMRQLMATGWMHNRARLIVGSFLTKDLLIDWRRGERHFMAHLTDGDLANNNGGWQWVASTGTDPQPYFRIFNPVLQAERFDPNGAFVRRWVPELEGVPLARLHEPWKMSGDEQRAAGCVIGRDYPSPIADHAEARQRALAAYSAVRNG